MPGKARSGKGKHYHQSKKSKAMQRHGAAPVPPQAMADTPQPDAAVSQPPPSRIPASPAKSRTPQYPYFSSELRKIGILAVIILVILIVLARVLP
jgi:hypothetical protein